MTGGDHELWALPCALGAAAAFGVANVAQMRAARRTRASGGIDPWLLLRLFRDRLWLSGLGASVAGYGLQAVALFLAPVVLVQPLIVTELLFALPLAALLAGVRLGRREWAGVLLVAAGLAVFVIAAHPVGERTHLPSSTWITLIVAVTAGVIALVVIAEAVQRRPLLRASALAAAASVCFGLMSVDTKVVGHEFADQGLGAFLAVQPWLLGLAAGAGLLFAQTAFRIAPLSASLPVIDVGEPLIASLLAITAFHEQPGHGPGAMTGIAAAATIVATGVALLDTSPLIRATYAQRHTATDPPTAHATPGHAAGKNALPRESHGIRHGC